MQRKPSITFLGIVIMVAILAGAGCAKLRARDQLNKGVEAFKSGQFDAAIEHFKSARELDPTLTNAQLYLASAYAQQYVPGRPTDENIRNGQEAIKVNQDILSADPNNLSAIDNLGSLLFNMAKTPFDEQGMNNAKGYQEKHIQLSPNDPAPYYWMGVIDWSLAYRTNQDMRQEYNVTAKKQLKNDDPLPPNLMKDFTAKDGKDIDEAITNLNKAIQLKPDYDDAMAYLSLLYRQKADTETSADARTTDEKQADDLVDKVKAIKQKKEEAAGGQQTS
jgi:tetratricopeptide (TPR) repeat protein